MTVGDELDVELEFPEPLKWSARKVDLIDSGSSGSGWLTDIVTAVDREGVTTVDLAGAPLMIDTVGEAPLGIVGLIVRFSAEDVEIHIP